MDCGKNMNRFFYPSKSPITKKYGITDGNGQIIVDYKYDIILDIINVH